MKYVLQKLFCNIDGKLVLAQIPNPPIMLWAISAFMGHFIKSGAFGHLLDVVGFGALFTWAWMEIFDGTTYFRRFLGVVVIVVIVSSRI